MATKFVYEQADTTAKDIDNYTNTLISTLNTLNETINSNIGNDKVWSGEAASSLLLRWNQFYENNYDFFVNTFKVQNQNVRDAIQQYHAFEQNNTY